MEHLRYLGRQRQFPLRPSNSYGGLDCLFAVLWGGPQYATTVEVFPIVDISGNVVFHQQRDNRMSEQGRRAADRAFAQPLDQGGISV